MGERRISLRFRDDNEKDMQAWKILEEQALMKNASKNSIAIELMINGAVGRREMNEDAFAEQIAVMVANRVKSMLKEMTVCSEGRGSGRREETVSGENRADSRADEPVLIGEDALDFLDAFG